MVGRVWICRMQEAGCDAVDVPTFPVLFVEIVKCKHAVECVLPWELGCKEEVKLAKDGNMQIDDRVGQIAGNVNTHPQRGAQQEKTKGIKYNKQNMKHPLRKVTNGNNVKE